MTDDDYNDLREKARSALYDLLMASDPGSGGALRLAYRQLGESLEPEEPPPTPRSKVQQQLDEHRRLREGWQRHPMREREHLVLNALGDDRLTIRELRERLDDELERHVYDGDVRVPVRRLFDAGELDRVGERRAKGDHHGAIRWRYFRKRPSDDLVQLERTFHDDEIEGGDR